MLRKTIKVIPGPRGGYHIIPSPQMWAALHKLSKRRSTKMRHVRKAIKKVLILAIHEAIKDKSNNDQK